LVIDLDPVTIVDLACGTGSTLRALSPHLPARQTWRLVDNDLSLLARAADSARPERAQVKALPVDLAHDLEAALGRRRRSGHHHGAARPGLRALLDRLVTEIAARRLAALRGAEL